MNDKIDHQCTSEIVCPYCGYKDIDSWELDMDNAKIECGECGKEFEYERNITVEYSTYKIEPDNKKQI